jgi:DNA-binding response OmpR family regulator
MTKEKIMIVDDNKELLEELKEILALSGYEPLTISNGEFAINAARKFRPDAIILDLRMNGINGFQIAAQLKRTAETTSIPIIAMSGYYPIENDSNILDTSQMDVRLKKPFSVMELITQIERILSKDKRK